MGRGVSTESPIYRGYLYALASVPALGLFVGFREMQKIYAVFGASFMPLLAIVLLILNGREEWVGKRYRNGPWTSLVLPGTIAFFLTAAYLRFSKIP